MATSRRENRTETSREARLRGKFLTSFDSTFLLLRFSCPSLAVVVNLVTAAPSPSRETVFPRLAPCTLHGKRNSGNCCLRHLK